MQSLVLVFVLAWTLLIFPCTHVYASTKDIRVDAKEVVYPLPYPGILADHPLYSRKSVRDNILFFTTRDTMKKAELSLHYSDKHVSIALALINKGKEQLAIQELERAEEYAARIPQLLATSKKQGVAPSNDFIMNLYQSNEKHREIITELMKKTTQAQIDVLNGLLTKNTEIKKAIASYDK